MSNSQSEEILKRLNVEIPIDLHDDVKKNIPWGLKSQVVRVLLQLLLDHYRVVGYRAIGDLLEGRLTLSAAHSVNTREESCD